MENKNPLFSIIVPIYNVENYLRECLDSVKSQTVTDFECIMVNDGSTDFSGDIATEYTLNDKRFIKLTQENQGLSGARNTGIRNARGQYIVFLDGDDFFKSDALENLNTLIKKDCPDIIISSSIAYYEDSKSMIPREWTIPEKWSTQGELLDIISNTKNFILAAWCIVVQKEYLLKNNLMFYPGLKHEDELWVPQTIIKAAKISTNPNPYYCGRCDRIGSITQTKDITKLFHKLFIIDELIKFAGIQSTKNKNSIEKRCTKIITGMIKQANQYENEKEYSKLCNKLMERLYILKFESNLKYKLLYISCYFCGVKVISKIWNLKR